MPNVGEASTVGKIGAKHCHSASKAANGLTLTGTCPATGALLTRRARFPKKGFEYKTITGRDIGSR